MPPKTWACASNSKEEASIIDSKEDALIEGSGEDVENAEDMEVSLDDESDEGGNYQADFEIKMQPRRMGKSPSSKMIVPMQAQRYPQQVNRHPPCCGTQQKLHVPHRGIH